MAVKTATSPYRIFRIELEDRPGAPQLAFSRGTYKVNFGSRQGVKVGSVFDVFEGAYEPDAYVGIVRVEQTWRDSARVRLVNLERKANRAEIAPLTRRCRLFPRYVLLETIYFDVGNPVFMAEMNDRMRFAARFILAFPSFPVVLEGHTDNAGKRETNLALGAERARKISRFLHEIHLIPEDQLHAVGYADTKPIATNSTDEGRRANRRVDIVVVNQLPSE